MIENDEQVPGDRRTFEILKIIANSIDKDIKVTIDVPSDHPELNDRVPYLDTMIWMEYTDENYPQGKLMHKHYKKPMASKVGVQRNSAINERDQRTINTQEVMRCLRNCHEDLQETEVEEVLSQCMKQLQNSGYDQKYRKEILESAQNGIKKQKEADQRGEKPMYRPKGYRKLERVNEKKDKKKNWFKKGGKQSYFIIPATPNSQLKKMIQGRLKALKVGESIRIVERSGQRFIEVWQQQNKRPKKIQCNDPNCLVGMTENGGNCRKNGVVYAIKCKECEDIYTGETSRNAHTRSIQHMNDAHSNNEDDQEKSVLLRHMKEKHDGNNVPFEMKVIKAYQHDPLGRQCAEAVQIKNVEPSKRINNKTEFHQPGDVEFVYEKNENENQKKKKRMMQEKKMQDKPEKQVPNTESVGGPKPTDITIMDFISRMRERANDVTKQKKNTEEDDNSLSSQEMINDARERRLHKEKVIQCDQCDYKSASKTLVMRHQKAAHFASDYSFDQCEYMARTKGSLASHKQTVHNTISFKCNQCDHKEKTEVNIKKHQESAHEKKGKSKYVSKRIQCEKCEKKFNKSETFKTHMKKVHNMNLTSKENETQISILNNLNAA